MVLLLRSTLHFEGIVGLFTFVSSFMYHLCQASTKPPPYIDGNGVRHTPEPSWGLGESEWHRLDNIGAITSLMLLALHLADLAPSRERKTAAYVIMLTNVCVQMHPSFAYNIRFTALPIAAAFALCIGRHFARLVARRRDGRSLRSGAPPIPWLKRLFPGEWWRVCVGVAAFAVAAYCFSVGLDDDLGPPQLLWHGCWHLFGGLGMWHLWQALPLAPPPPSLRRASPRAHGGPARPPLAFAALMPLCGYGALLACYGLSMAKDWRAATYTHCRAGGTPNVFTSTSACIGFSPQREIWQLLIVGGLIPLQLATAIVAYREFSTRLARGGGGRGGGGRAGGASRLAVRNVLLLAVHVVELGALATLSLVTSSDMWLPHVAATAVWTACSPLHCWLYVGLYGALVQRGSAAVSAPVDEGHGGDGSVAAAENSAAVWSAACEARALRFRSAALRVHVIATTGGLLLWVLHNTMCVPYLYSLFGIFECAQIATNIAFNQECVCPPFAARVDPMQWALCGGGGGGGATGSRRGRARRAGGRSGNASHAKFEVDENSAWVASHV